ncbi:hypothetical protein TIFTF001_020522 [Ficus carica]|uniref:Uncharacterized protein n=1 Tax=Ficus carica TaxID=3494 RepID=A0AA88ARP0_FICCA|nr:hypothetical protein TIFTF001_020522 [Ficus carica]
MEVALPLSGQPDDSQWGQSTGGSYLVNRMEPGTELFSLPFSGQQDKGLWSTNTVETAIF